MEVLDESQASIPHSPGCGDAAGRRSGSELIQASAFLEAASASPAGAAPFRNSRAEMNRTPTISPLRQIKLHTRRTSPPAVRERPNTLGTARSPTSRQAPLEEMSRM